MDNYYIVYITYRYHSKKVDELRRSYNWQVEKIKEINSTGKNKALLNVLCPEGIKYNIIQTIENRKIKSESTQCIKYKFFDGEHLIAYRKNTPLEMYFNVRGLDIDTIEVAEVIVRGSNGYVQEKELLYKTAKGVTLFYLEDL